MTQIEFARRIGVKQQTVSRWETGVVIPDAMKLDDIARILGIDMTELVTLRYKAEVDRRNAEPSPAATALAQRTETRVKQLEQIMERLLKTLDQQTRSATEHDVRMDRIERALNDLSVALGRQPGKEDRPLRAPARKRSASRRDQR